MYDEDLLVEIFGDFDEDNVARFGAEMVMQGRCDSVETVPNPDRPKYDPCTCKLNRSQIGWSYDVRRNMYVCGECLKPSPYNPGYNRECDVCEEEFTVEVFDGERFDGDFGLCGECESANS